MQIKSGVCIYHTSFADDHENTISMLKLPFDSKGYVV